MGHSRTRSSWRIETRFLVRSNEFCHSLGTPSSQFSAFHTRISENASCAIMMFDVTNKASYRHLEDWHEDILRCCNSSKSSTQSTMPIVVCGNKADLDERQVFPRHTVFPKKYGYPYFDVSAKCNFNFEAVFLSLIRQHLQ